MMQNFRTKNNNLLLTGFVIGMTLLIGCVNLIDVKMSLVLIVTLTVLLFFYARPNYILAALIFLVPFSGTALLSQKMAGVPGLKIVNVVLLNVLLIYVVSKIRLKIKVLELAFLVGVVLLLTVSVVRSLPHLNLINYYLDESMGVGKYFMTHLVKQLFYFVPFLIIVGYVRDRGGLDFLVSCFKFSMLFLSLFILFFYLFEVPYKTDFEFVRWRFGQFFNMHTNNLADFYILGYPLVLSWFLHERKLVNVLNLLFSLSCVVILYSRTAYVLVVFSTFMLLALNKKKKILPIILVFVVCASLISPGAVVERGMTGIDEGSLQKFSAGRIHNIWIPVMKELSDDPVRILIGGGRHSIIHSTSIDKGHAHNMYLGALLDVGIVGLVFFVGFFVYFVKSIKDGLRRAPEGEMRVVLGGILVSIMAFLISGLAGRSFFPDITNSYLWILVALGLSISRKQKTEGMSRHEGQEGKEGLLDMVKSSNSA